MAACTCDRKRRGVICGNRASVGYCFGRSDVLNKVDSLKYENGVYYLTLSQGEYGNKKLILQVQI